MSRAAAIAKMREASRLMTEAEQELADVEASEPPPARPREEVRAEARRRLRKIGVAV